MSDENSQMGILSVDDAVDHLVRERSANPEEEDQAAPDAEEAEGDDEVEEETDTEDEATSDEDDSDAEEDDDSTADEEDDGDTEEEPDEDELNKGYMRQADYTRKTQELAREREKLESDRKQFDAHAQHQLDQLQKAAEYFAVPTDEEPNWSELARTLEPKEYQQKQAEWAEKQRKAQQAQQVRENLQHQQYEETRQAEASKLLDRVPEWRDESVQKAEVSEIVSVAGEYGISPEEIGSIMDHRQLLLLRDLAQSKRAQKAVAQKKAKPAKKPKAAAGPAKEDPKRKAERQASSRLKNSGSPDDAVAALLARSGSG